MTLEAKIRSAALAYTPLSSLLGTSPFRFYDTQLVQGTLFPAIAFQEVGGSPTYAFTGRLPTGYSRYQFTIWDTDAERGRAVEAALLSFFDQLNLQGIPGLSLYPCRVVSQKAGMFTDPQPPQF